MSSCFGSRKKKGTDTEPLLPRYEDDTERQRELHKKLHSYQMIRALTKGYMPSTEQVIANLRTLLATDLLNSQNPELSPSGKRLIRYTREWLKAFIEIVRRKNSQDEIQDFIWYTSKSDISVDTKHISQQASRVKARADATAGKSE